MIQVILLTALCVGVVIFFICDAYFKNARSKDTARLSYVEEELYKQQQASAQLTQKYEQLKTHYQQAQTHGALETQKAQMLNQSLQDLQKQKNQVTIQLEQLQQQYHQLQLFVNEQTNNLQFEQQKIEDLKQQFEQQKHALKDEFKVVSESIIKERQQMLNQQNEQGLGALLKPLQEQIVGFQQRINQVHTESLTGNTQLKEEIKKVMDIGLSMRDEATNLATALKGNSQQRGAWGEAQLERTLEMSGLQEHTHFEKQSSFKDQDGKNKLTDYLVKLPGNKHIIIDSKVSLIAYDKAVSAQTEAEQMLALAEHVKSVKNHINDLASKDYTNLIGMHSPSFVLMFMPIEPAYIEALKHDKDLFGYGYSNNIVLVSHTTLIPILRTVANLWMMEKSNEEAREMSDKAGEIYNSVCLVAQRLQKLGNTLNTASEHYNKTVTAIAGKQGLHGKVERFQQLSSKISKNMPELQHKNYDHDIQQLSITALHDEKD